MVQGANISLEFFSSGYCEAHASIANPINGKGKTRFYAVWALLNFPTIGYVLFDTGYSEDFQNATKSFPSILYRWATPVTIHNNDTALSILASRGIKAEQINYVIISHFHADHICGLRDFPNAKFICTKAAYEQVSNHHGFASVSRGILHGLIPSDLENRILFIEDIADHVYIDNFGLKTFKMFGTEEFRLILLPGHARGMLGFTYETTEKRIIYATDASWSYDTFLQIILPSKIVKLFFDSWHEYIETQQKLRAFQSKNPQFKVLFTHCPETLNHIENEI
jgi:glyoxylase-like metal-dependent hydrolase (beta-lactamase superfamily II)